jgi:hypothetical protein
MMSQYLKGLLVGLTICTICNLSRLVTVAAQNVKIKLQNQTIFPGELIDCIIASTVPINYTSNRDPKGQVRVVFANQLNNIANTTSNIVGYSAQPNVPNETQLNLYVRYDNILGLLDYQDTYDLPSITNVTVMDWTTVEPLHVVVVNEQGDTILGKSDPFRITNQDVTMTFLERSYFPGEGLNWILSSAVDV